MARRTQRTRTAISLTDTEQKDRELQVRLHTALSEFSRCFDDVSDEEFERALADAHREYREITDREHGRE